MGSNITPYEIEKQGQKIRAETTYEVKCPFCEMTNVARVGEWGDMERIDTCIHFKAMDVNDLRNGGIFKKEAEKDQFTCPFCETKTLVEHHDNEVMDYHPNGCVHMQHNPRNNAEILFVKANSHAEEDEIDVFDLDESKPLEVETMSIANKTEEQAQHV